MRLHVSRDCMHAAPDHCLNIRLETEDGRKVGIRLTPEQLAWPNRHTFDISQIQPDQGAPCLEHRS